MQALIVDDHPLFRQGMKALLSALDAAVQVTDVGSLVDVQALHASGYSPELVLLDMHLPGVAGLQALHNIKELFESASVVVVSGDEDPNLILSAIDAGAAGYVPKTTDPEVTTHALRLVLANGTYLPAAALAHATVRAHGGTRVGADAPTFSQRQRDVLRALLQGKSNKVIARELGMAEGTVKAHLWAVYQALGVNTRPQAMVRAHELGLFSSIQPV